MSRKWQLLPPPGEESYSTWSNFPPVAQSTLHCQLTPWFGLARKTGVTEILRSNKAHSPNRTDRATSASIEGVRPPPQTDTGWWSACTSSFFCKQWTPSPPLCNLRYRKMRQAQRSYDTHHSAEQRSVSGTGLNAPKLGDVLSTGRGALYLSEISQVQGHSYRVMQGSKDHMHKGDKHLSPM